MAEAETEQKCPEKKPEEKPEEKPWVILDWDQYYKNRGLISTRMGVKKSEYIKCSAKLNKPPKNAKDGEEGKEGKKGKKGKKGGQKGCKMDPKKPPPCCCSSCPGLDPYVAKCPGVGQKGKPNRDYMRCFTVNMVVVRVDMPGGEFECRDKLMVKAEVCRGCKLTLCADRIDVNCLPAETLKQFQMEPECLARQLAEGITIILVYKKKELGRGCYEVPAAVIDRMVNQFEEVVHDGTVELTCCNCTVGLIRVRFSMQMRCQIFKEVAEGGRLAGGGCCLPEPKKEKSVDRNVNPQDMPFMAEGYSSSSLDPCAGFMPSDMEEPLEFSSCSGSGEDTCPNQPPQLIDMAGPFPVYSCPNMNEGCLDVTIEPPAGPSAQFTTEQRHVLGDGSTNRLCQKLSSPKLRQMHISGTRSCLLCGEDVTWLPKVAACPYCGYKAVPEFKEREYDENATAEQILLDHLDNPVDELSFDLGSVEGCPDNGDEAGTPGSTSEAFETVVRDYQTLRRSILASSKTKACQSVSQKQTKTAVQGDQPRPEELSKVFAELRDLFKEKTVDEEKKIQDICAEACKMAKAKKGKRSPQRSQDRKSGGEASDPNDACEVPKKKEKRKPRKRTAIKSKYYEMYSPKNRVRIKEDYTAEDAKVPGHMGWLWTAHELASKPGWRPGAIRRSIRDLMSYFLQDYPVDTVPVSKYMSFYNQKPPPPSVPTETCEDLVQVPTLHIEKKNDVYTITLRPLKDPKSLALSANPYADMKPVQFRIVKNPLMKELRDMKRCLKEMGFSKCKCHKPVVHCYCRSFVDKKRLVYNVRRECERRHLEPCEDDLVLSDTSDSETEFDFGVTPPAGLMHPERLNGGRHIKHTETQYDEADWTMPTLLPHPPNPQVQFESCVMGERKKALNWIYGKGIIDEKPKKPKMRNMPKKKKKRRQVGGFSGREYQESSIYSRLNNNSAPLRLNSPPDYSTDSELPLSGEHMRLLDQAAYPPTAPQRLEPWALELQNERKRRRVKRRTKKLVHFDPTIEGSDSCFP